MTLDLKSIKLIRSRRILFNKFNLKLKKSQIIILIGDNGSGKSSLMDLIVGILKPNSGEIKIEGNTIHELGKTIRNFLLYIPHQNNLKDNITVQENLTIWLNLLDFSLDLEQLYNNLKFFDLLEYKDILVKNLSHGQKKKVSLVKLLYSKAKIWLLDEPLNGLDKKSSVKLIKKIESFSHSGGAILISSHIDLKIKNARKIKIKQFYSENKKNKIDSWANL